MSSLACATVPGPPARFSQLGKGAVGKLVTAAFAGNAMLSSVLPAVQGRSKSLPARGVSRRALSPAYIRHQTDRVWWCSLQFSYQTGLLVRMAPAQHLLSNRHAGHPHAGPGPLRSTHLSQVSSTSAHICTTVRRLQRGPAFAHLCRYGCTYPVTCSCRQRAPASVCLWHNQLLALPVVTGLHGWSCKV